MTRSTRLTVVLVLNLLLVAGLVAVGVTAHSLGVLAEGADYVADAAAIGLSLLAISLAGRPPTSALVSGGLVRLRAKASPAPGPALRSTLRTPVGAAS